LNFLNDFLGVRLFSLSGVLFCWGWRRRALMTAGHALDVNLLENVIVVHNHIARLVAMVMMVVLVHMAWLAFTLVFFLIRRSRIIAVATLRF